MAMTIRETWHDGKESAQPRTKKVPTRRPKFRVTPQQTEPAEPVESIEAIHLHDTPFTESVLIRGNVYGLTTAEYSALKQAAAKNIDVDQFIANVCAREQTIDAMKGALRKATARFLRASTSIFTMPLIISRNKFGRRC